jgi:hypothetical protein
MQRRDRHPNHLSSVFNKRYPGLRLWCLRRAHIGKLADANKFKANSGLAPYPCSLGKYIWVVRVWMHMGFHATVASRFDLLERGFSWLRRHRERQNIRGSNFELIQVQYWSPRHPSRRLRSFASLEMLFGTWRALPQSATSMFVIHLGSFSKQKEQLPWPHLTIPILCSGLGLQTSWDGAFPAPPETTE